MIYKEFMDAGYRVFGIHKIVDCKCSCAKKDCSAPGKHPFATAWQHTPEWSDEQLNRMEKSGQFDTGYGVLVSGLLVVDVDARNGGIDSYNKLIEDVPDIVGAGLIVNTGSGGGSKHLYFSVSDDVALMQHHNDYPGIDFKSSGFVIGPGSMHASGNKYEVAVGSPFDIEPAPKELIELLKKPDKRRVLVNEKPVDVSDDEVSEMVSWITPDCDYESWIRIGMAIHHVTNGAGFDIWDKWSSGGKSYDASEMDTKWFSFGKSSNPVGMGTLIHYAEQAGYEVPVDFSIEDDEEDGIVADGMPFSIDGVDLLRPPGFVGDVCQWINDQCRYPREHLAVGAALTTIGNIIGMRYSDGYSGVSANLFTFCIAASSTGKESIMTAVGEIHRAAGISGACHGTIKSEQEIIRNLIHHQAALYTIDEIGILLQKIDNASTRGGATYLEGVIGMLMSAYSKADSFMPLSGDVRREAQKEMLKEASICKKKIDENEDKSGFYEAKFKQLDRALSVIDSGIERPFLSLIGYTTPITFENLVTRTSISNGFIGRSILINERETNPRAKKRFKRSIMSDGMKNTLIGLSDAGTFDASITGGRIEFTGDKTEIPSSESALDMLDACQKWFEDYAERHKEMSGLEAAIRRGFEMVIKISFILATPEGIRTNKHVRWAFSFVYRDINDKTMMAYANEHKDNKKESVKVLMARILGQIDKTTGASVATLKNRLRKSTSDIEKVLQIMLDSGQVYCKEETNKKNKRITKKWFAK